MTRFKFFGFLLPLAMAGGMALGLMSAPAAAHDCSRHAADSTHKHCDDDVGGTKYTVQLFDGDSYSEGVFSDGAFCLPITEDPPNTEDPQKCGQVDVIASSDGALLVGQPLLLNRPNDGGELDMTWDGVFNTCPDLFQDLFQNPVKTLTANNWRVKLTTGKAKVDEVRVQFIRATPDNAETEVTLQLIDRGPLDFDGDETFLPVAVDDPKIYTLDNYTIFAPKKGTNPRLHCDNTGDGRLLPRGIVLEITLKP